MTDAELLRLNGVSFSYEPGKPVLDRLDLSLKPGERLGIIGRNGSGKTTMLHVILGLLAPSSGTVRFDGREVRGEPDFRELRANVGMMFQEADDQLFCATVGDDVAFGPFNLGLPRGEVAARVDETIESLGLGDFRQRPTSRLSHGEKRLVCLAGVLAMRPRALLLDEPSASLDEQSRGSLLEILGGLDTAMLLVSHDTRFIDAICGGKRRELRGGRLEQ